MEIMDVIITLQRYSEEMLAYKLDAEFVAAVDAAASLLQAQGERITDLENELRDEMYRHDRLQDFEVAEAQQFAEDKEIITMLRKKWLAAESLICAHCTECECETLDSLLVMQKKCGNLVGFPDCDMFTSRNAVELLQMKHAHRWIPVTERLPEDDLPKGSKAKQLKVFVAYRTNGRWVVRTQIRVKGHWYRKPDKWDWIKTSDPITHWMPLPEPPKEDASDANS